jgi:two-component system sensor histidine kinase/response regulator
MPVAAFASQNLRPDQKFSKHADGTRPRVLYAEDSTASRIVTTAMLKRMGLEVDAVEDGELALRQAEKSLYDVILLDIEMPVMDGVTAARGIRALGGKTSKTPILALSAFLADSTEFSHWRDAFDHAVPKPANSNELHRAIRGVLKSPLPKAAPVIVEPAKPGSVLNGLRATLPKGAWIKLMTLAAAESIHYANAAAAAFEAGDAETTQRCAHALRGLASNFEATDVEKMALEIERNGANRGTVYALQAGANAWAAKAKAGII